MTFHEWGINQLEQNGIFEQDVAETIMQAIEADEANAAMAGRWTEDVEGYPDVMKAVLWLSIKDHALIWIDQNKPRAWYRPMFAN